MGCSETPLKTTLLNPLARFNRADCATRLERLDFRSPEPVTPTFRLAKVRAGIELDLENSYGQFNRVHMNQDGVIR